MNTRKMAVLVAVLGLLMVWTTGAYAANAKYTCKVITTGPVTRGPSGDVLPKALVQFKLTRVSGTPAFTTVIAQAASGQEKQMLATALTAMVNSRNVEVYLNPDAANPIVYNMQLK